MNYDPFFSEFPDSIQNSGDADELNLQCGWH